MTARPLTGIFPPIATPLRDRDTLDVPAFERLIEHILAGGVHGLFLLGTTGEGTSLSTRLRGEMIAHGCRQVAGRVPLMVGITDESFVESVRLAERAADAGAHSVVIAPPSYPIAGQDELVGYVKRLVAAVPLPVFLYHIPSLTKVGFGSETVRRLMDVSRVIGIKDSGRQMDYLHELVRAAAARPDFTVLVGPEELLAEGVLFGAHGAMCGGANMLPRLYVDLYNAARAGDLSRVRELHDRVMRITAAIYTVGTGWSSYLRGLKCALRWLGLCDDALAEPFEPFGPAERETVRQRLVELGMLGTHGPS